MSVNKSIFSIVSASVITKVIIAIFIILMVGSLSDTYDMRVYYTAAQNVIGGDLPWANGHDLFDYPILSLVPIMFSYLISSITNGGFLTFTYCMMAIMILCDIITSVCVFFIGKKIYSDKTALIAALLCSTSISVAYYSFFKFDAFPACIAVLAITFTLYNKNICGYLSGILGMFVKIWPVILYPFLWLYNSKDTSLIEESKKALPLLVIGSGIFVGLMILGYDQFLMVMGFSYCNTLAYMISYSSGLPLIYITILFKILIGVIILSALYIMYKKPRSARLLIKLILISLLAVVYLSHYRSPQYIVWFSPLVALLIADDGWGICAFILFQIISFIEYPFVYGMIYDNQNYFYPWTIWFFVAYFIVLIILMWRAFKK